MGQCDKDLKASISFSWIVSKSQELISTLRTSFVLQKKSKEAWTSGLYHNSINLQPKYFSGWRSKTGWAFNIPIFISINPKQKYNKRTTSCWTTTRDENSKTAQIIAYNVRRKEILCWYQSFISNICVFTNKSSKRGASALWRLGANLHYWKSKWDRLYD